ncbi:DegT/DnrJ/EryC1/StrS family aminotransferase [Tunicatimonas pelagia]|uniref:DegT/DnrJ/EryC1/StrS family aminotransferase n=1 Tax=Tunicatimonas pelagia TaxID=931531 RepID=UPI002665A4F0|nr:DegT/DnrJ/EryC1/StrS family aminotransferase [Tunicatimonas pelagia]WKN43253.1 DegT/DnrJ/EryC1/StrS family aminotransferase [Tunicatimonas pelagia]
MQIPFVNLRRQHEPILADMQAALNHLISSNRLMGGEAIQSFETKFADYLGVCNVVSCANATDALEIVLRAWRIQPGDEIIIPANGWMSAAEAIRLLGATPVLVDNHPNTFNIDLQKLSEKIGARTKAIVPIHLYGNPVDMKQLTGLADSHGLKVLEDCAQAHGASVDTKKVGCWGEVGIFSFYPTKNLGAVGDGGAIATNNNALAERCRAIANHGQLEKHTHTILGRNSRMDAWQAKVLSLKIPYLERWNRRRQQIANHYLESWQKLPIKLPQKNDNAVWHLFVVQVENRDKVRGDLAKLGIQTEVHYPIPVCQQPLFEKFRDPAGYPNAERQAHHVLSIPLYPELTDVEVEYIVAAVKKVTESVVR